jgi:hypothetical protein
LQNDRNGASLTVMSTPRRALLAALVFLTGCGDDPSEDNTGGSSGTASTSLPDVCAYDSSFDPECADVSAGKRAVLCQGAPTEMITRLKCKYQSSILGTGNFYCCP